MYTRTYGTLRQERIDMASESVGSFFAGWLAAFRREATALPSFTPGPADRFRSRNAPDMTEQPPSSNPFGPAAARA